MRTPHQFFTNICKFDFYPFSPDYIYDMSQIRVRNIEILEQKTYRRIESGIRVCKYQIHIQQRVRLLLQRICVSYNFTDITITQYSTGMPP